MLTVLNDWHLGAVRSAGTTPATAYQLRQDLLTQFEEQLYAIDTDLMILGDLFDGPNISMADLLRAFEVLSDWLARTTKRLYLVNGNHDLSKDASRLSSFELLCKLLVNVHGRLVVHIEQPTTTPHGHVIPHLANQDLFDLALQQVPPGRCLFVHCNYDNQFAVESDHSLNLSKEAAEALPVEYIVFAHEHQGRTELGGKVVVIGNQVPSSVSDCLGRQPKSRLVVGEKLEFHQTWEPDRDFAEVDWEQLSKVADLPHRFIRVTGVATPDEASLVVTAIARFRAASPALVITNSVKIHGRDDSEQLELSHEQIQSFDVLAALLEILSPEEGAKLVTLYKER